MTWLLPLGFLGLISILFLIVIYIVKPNYQQKYVSTTYVWKLSLKYRKNRLPISRINNIITFICQLLILTLCALLLAKPVVEYAIKGDENEKVIIIDASASMLVSDGEKSRFDRAVEEAKTLAEETLDGDGVISVIIADDTPEILIQRIGAENRDELSKLDALVSEENTACSYSSADMTSAVALSEEILRSNSEAQVYLYTATTYTEKNGITVKKISAEGEWNAAVLNVTAEMNENNHYEISVDVGCYGKTEMVKVFCAVHGANGKEETPLPIERAEYFDPSEDEKTIVFTTDDFGGDPLLSYDYIEVYVSAEDSFSDDNSFFLYGGKKQTIRVQYASSSPNNFFGGVFRTIRQNMRGKWDIEFVELKADEPAATTGFDFYIFEHTMPDTVPTDGLVLLVDPENAPNGAGFRIGQPVSVNSTSTLAAGAVHDLTKHTDSSRVTIAKYIQIISSDGYEELAYYNGNPVMLVKDEPGAKIVVWAFDLNYSNIIAMPDFSFLMYNMFNYFIPSTFSSYAYEIGDTVTLNSRGPELKVSGDGKETSFDSVPASITLTKPGTYTVTQKHAHDDNAYVVESFFVRIPAYESDITKEVDELPLISADETTGIGYEDLLFYFALLLVSLMLVEWVLQIKKNF